MNDKELQQAFLQFLAKKSGAKNQQELEKYVQSLGEDGLKQAYDEFTKVMTQKAAHGAKLQYFRNLKHKCGENEELVFYKKGGSVECGCKGKKMEKGGQTSTNPVDKFKEIRKAQSGTKNYTKGQLAGEEPVKIVNGVKYFLNGDGQVVKDPKGRNSAKPGDKNWKTAGQTYDPKTGKMRPATKEELEQRAKNRKDATQGKGEGNYVQPNAQNSKKVVKKAGAGCIAEFKKKFAKGGSLNGIPFIKVVQ